MGIVTSSCRGRSTTRAPTTTIACSGNNSSSRRLKSSASLDRKRTEKTSANDEFTNLHDTCLAVSSGQTQPRIRIYKEFVPKRRRGNSNQSESGRCRYEDKSAPRGKLGNHNSNSSDSSSRHDSLESLFLRTQNYLITTSALSNEQQQQPNFAIVNFSKNFNSLERVVKENNSNIKKSQSLLYLKTSTSGSDPAQSTGLTVDKCCQVNIK